MSSRSENSAVEEIVVAIGLDIVYLEHDEYAHFDPISVTATAALLLLHGYFEGIVDAARSAGNATATKLTRRLHDLHQKPATPRLPTVDPADAQRYGDVAQAVLQKALVEHGFPLRKASAIAETVRDEAEALIASEAE